MNTRRRLALALALAGLVLVATAGISLAAPAYAPAELALRLTDIGAGYVIWTNECEAQTLRGDETSSVVNTIAELPHRDCEIGFLRVWVAPGAPAGPTDVSSRTLVFDGPTGPQAALTRPRAVASSMYLPTRDELQAVEPRPTIGDKAVLLQASQHHALGPPSWDAIVLWRSGSVLAIVEVSSTESADASAQAALRLAAAQQTRIAAPTPLTAADNDDSEVGLSTPGFDLPIYWFGRRLAAHGKLPDLPLNVSAPLSIPRGSSMVLLYGPVSIDLWRPRTLRRSYFSDFLRSIASDPCTHHERVSLPQGRGTIWSFGGHGCDARLRTSLAFVRLPGVVVELSVNIRRRPVPRYASRTGMLRLLRSLQLYAPAP